MTAGCGTNTTSLSGTAGCGTNHAAIAVYEGMLQNLCGCTGAGQNGAVAASGSTLTCTVPVGTTVFFQFIEPTGEHQIEAVGTPTFAASPINTFHAVTFLTAASTYTYRDAFNTALQGQIIVP